MGPLFLYHLRLAARSLRRNGTLSFGMFLSLALATSLFATILEHYLRNYEDAVTLAPDLHQVELPHTLTLMQALGHTNAEPGAHATRTRVSYPEYEALASTGIPARQTAAIRSRLLVAGDGVPPRLVTGRFVDPDFFAMFRIPIGAGRVFARGDAEDVVVLGEPLARALAASGSGAVGRSLFIEGKAFRVVGVVEGDQRYRPTWDLASIGGSQDALYLPTPWFRRLLARPETVIIQSPVGPTFDDLLRSDAVFVSFWTQLPTPASRAAYDAAVTRLFPGKAYKLRAYQDWLVDLAMPDSSIRFYFLLSGLVLLGGGFNMARLLLAKGLARRDELGIYRALGATRRSLFVRHLLESAMIGLPAAVAGALAAFVYNSLFNLIVADTDIPLYVTARGFGITVLVAFATAILAALYPAWHVSRTPPTSYMGRA